VVETDLIITGKVAQFGRGVLADVSAKLLDQFVVNLESMVLVTEDVGPPTSKAAPKSAGDTKAAPTKKQVTKPAAPKSSGGTKAAPTKKRATKSTASVDVAPSLGPDEVDERGATVAGAGGPQDPSSEVRQIKSAPAEPIDLVDLARGSVARRVSKPLIVTGVVLALVVQLARRRRK
jgi:hypothetical protein